MEPIDEACERLRRLIAPHLTGILDQAVEKARNGSDDDKCDLVRVVDAYLFRELETGRPIGDWDPDEDVIIRKLLLEYTESIAERGHPRAMRYAACACSNGDNDRTVERTENGYRVRARPDYARALAWAVKGEQAGDPVAAKIRPGLEADLARQRAKGRGPGPKP